MSGLTNNFGMDSHNIFVICEDQLYNQLFFNNLNNFNLGLKCKICTNSQYALSECKKNIPDLIIIDLDINNNFANQLLSNFQNDFQLKQIPIVVITESNDINNHILTLDSGADDCITKPVLMTELLARLRSILRRYKKFFGEKTVQIGDIKINFSNRSVEVSNKDIKLSNKEFSILKLLAESRNKIFTREEILQAVWKNESIINARTIDVHINRLRVALGKNKGNKSYIRTIRNAGYCLDASDYNLFNNGNYMNYIGGINHLDQHNYLASFE